MNIDEIEALIRAHLNDIYMSTGKEFLIIRTRYILASTVPGELDPFYICIKDENGAKEYLKKVYESLEKELVQTEQEKQEIEEAAKKLWEGAAKKLGEDYIRDIKYIRPPKGFLDITAY